MAARASCSTPAQFSSRMRVRARLEKKVGSLGFLRILIVVDIHWFLVGVLRFIALGVVDVYSGVSGIYAHACEYISSAPL